MKLEDCSIREAGEKLSDWFDLSFDRRGGIAKTAKRRPKLRSATASHNSGRSDASRVNPPLERPLKGLNHEEVEAVLHRVQAFDPTGVAARDLRECLLLQLRQLPADFDWRAEAILLVDEHFDLLAHQNETQMRRRLKLDGDALMSVIQLIRSLNPRPGTSVASQAPTYVEPDVFVYKHNNQWRVELNRDAAPRLRVNPQYAGMVRRADNSSDNVTMKNHLQEARWFIKSLQSRNDTLLRVATQIVEVQRNFFEYGEEAMKPVGETEFVAGVAAMSESGAYGPTRLCEGIVGHADLVQDGGRDGPGVEAEVGQNLGDGQGVGDVGLTRGPALALVGGLGARERDRVDGERVARASGRRQAGSSSGLISASATSASTLNWSAPPTSISTTRHPGPWPKTRLNASGSAP